MRKPLSHREESILLLLRRFDFLTRDQINCYFKLGSTRNVNRVLNELSRYLSNVRDGYQAVYYLNKEGRAYVDCEKVRKKGSHRHTVMRNELWLHFGCPSDWKNEIKVSDGETTVIADAMFTYNWRKHFLEVDRMQTMKENRNKIERYKQLIDSLTDSFGHSPTIIWLTTTDHRRKQLIKDCEGIPIAKVYTIDDIK